VPIREIRGEFRSLSANRVSSVTEVLPAPPRETERRPVQPSGAGRRESGGLRPGLRRPVPHPPLHRGAEAGSARIPGGAGLRGNHRRRSGKAVAPCVYQVALCTSLAYQTGIKEKPHLRYTHRLLTIKLAVKL